MLTPRSFTTFLLTLLLAGCPAWLDDNGPQGSIRDFRPDDDDSRPADDDDATVADDDDSRPDDDDGPTWDELCHADDDPNDWDCDGIDNSIEGIDIIDDQAWVRKDLMGNLDLEGRVCLVGHNLGVADNDPDVDTDWAQCEFRFDCDVEEDPNFCQLPVEAVERMPVGVPMRLGISDGTSTALLYRSQPNVFDYWADFGPDYCALVSDPVCWDNEPYVGAPSHALCLDKQIVEGRIYLSPSTCGDTYSAQELGQ